MEQKKWFYLHQEQVKGPFTPTEVEKEVADGNSAAIAKFWSRGKPSWLTYSQFKQELVKDKEQEKVGLQKENERLWKVKENDLELQPMTYDTLLNFLKDKKNLANILLWTEGYQNWQEVYHIEKILDELGINRRQHPRVPVTGKIHLEMENGDLFEAELNMISQGGFGVASTNSLSIGELVRATIISPELKTNIHCTAEVVVINPQGGAGFTFINISDESRSSIISYVKKLVESNPSDTFTKMN